MRSVPLIVSTPPGAPTVGDGGVVLPHDTIVRPQTIIQRRDTGLGYLHAPVLRDYDFTADRRVDCDRAAGAAALALAGVRVFQPGGLCPGSVGPFGAVDRAAGRPRPGGAGRDRARSRLPGSVVLDRLRRRAGIARARVFA